MIFLKYRQNLITAVSEIVGLIKIDTGDRQTETGDPLEYVKNRFPGSV